MKQIFALTSAMLSVEFTNQYSGKNLIETLGFVEQRTGVTFDKIEETFRVTGQWPNLLEAYDILLNVLLTKDVEIIPKEEPKDFDFNLSVSLPPETNEASGNWQSTWRQFDETIQSRNIAKTGLEVDEHDNNNLVLKSRTYQSQSHFTAVQNNKDRVSRRKSMPCKLYLETDIDYTCRNVQQENLAVEKNLKSKSQTIKLTVKNKRGRKRKMKDENEIYKCLMCNYSGKTMYQLSRHKQRKHNDGERFQCNQCSKSYGVASDLNRHKKTVHETSLFVCETCNKS